MSWSLQWMWIWYRWCSDQRKVCYANERRLSSVSRSFNCSFVHDVTKWWCGLLSFKAETQTRPCSWQGWHAWGAASPRSPAGSVPRWPTAPPPWGHPPSTWSHARSSSLRRRYSRGWLVIPGGIRKKNVCVATDSVEAFSHQWRTLMQGRIYSRSLIFDNNVTGSPWKSS